MKLLDAINEMERAALSADTRRTTAEDLTNNGREEAEFYFYWLTKRGNFFLPSWEDLTDKPGDA